MPRLSVIIPAYNAAALLAPTLQAALDSRFSDLELVVIDDGSKDNTAEVASRFGPRVRVISQDNAGMSASRNRGIASSDSEFIALLDADDIWHADKAGLQIAALEARPDHDFAYTEFTTWDGCAPMRFPMDQVTHEIVPGLSGWIYHKLLLTNWVLPSSVLFRRSAWNKIGPFLCEDQQTDDWEFFVRASTQSRFVKLRDSMVLYRQHPSSLSRRVPPINNTELMREKLIARFGTQSPDGTPVDAQELARRRHHGWCNFASTHCVHGDLALGLRSFAQLALSGPRRLDTTKRMVKSIVRRMLTRSPKLIARRVQP